MEFLYDLAYRKRKKQEMFSICERLLEHVLPLDNNSSEQKETSVKKKFFSSSPVMLTRLKRSLSKRKLIPKNPRRWKYAEINFQESERYPDMLKNYSQTRNFQITESLPDGRSKMSKTERIKPESNAVLVRLEDIDNFYPQLSDKVVHEAAKYLISKGSQAKMEIDEPKIPKHIIHNFFFNQILDNVYHTIEIRNEQNQVCSVEYVANLIDEELEKLLYKLKVKKVKPKDMKVSDISYLNFLPGITSYSKALNDNQSSQTTNKRNEKIQTNWNLVSEINYLQALNDNQSSQAMTLRYEKIPAKLNLVSERNDSQTLNDKNQSSQAMHMRNEKIPAKWKLVSERNDSQTFNDNQSSQAMDLRNEKIPAKWNLVKSMKIIGEESSIEDTKEFASFSNENSSMIFHDEIQKVLKCEDNPIHTLPNIPKDNTHHQLSQNKDPDIKVNKINCPITLGTNNSITQKIPIYSDVNIGGNNKSLSEEKINYGDEPITSQINSSKKRNSKEKEIDYPLILVKEEEKIYDLSEKNKGHKANVEQKQDAKVFQVTDTKQLLTRNLHGDLGKNITSMTEETQRQVEETPKELTNQLILSTLKKASEQNDKALTQSYEAIDPTYYCTQNEHCKNKDVNHRDITRTIKEEAQEKNLIQIQRENKNGTEKGEEKEKEKREMQMSSIEKKQEKRENKFMINSAIEKREIQNDTTDRKTMQIQTNNLLNIKNDNKKEIEIENEHNKEQITPNKKIDIVDALQLPNKNSQNTVNINISTSNNTQIKENIKSGENLSQSPIHNTKNPPEKLTELSSDKGVLKAKSTTKSKNIQHKSKKEMNSFQKKSKININNETLTQKERDEKKTELKQPLEENIIDRGEKTTIVPPSIIEQKKSEMEPQVIEVKRVARMREDTKHKENPLQLVNEKTIPNEKKNIERKEEKQKTVIKQTKEEEESNIMKQEESQIETDRKSNAKDSTNLVVELPLLEADPGKKIVNANLEALRNMLNNPKKNQYGAQRNSNDEFLRKLLQLKLQKQLNDQQKKNLEEDEEKEGGVVTENIANQNGNNYIRHREKHSDGNNASDLQYRSSYLNEAEREKKSSEKQIKISETIERKVDEAKRMSEHKETVTGVHTVYGQEVKIMLKYHDNFAKELEYIKRARNLKKAINSTEDEEDYNVESLRLRKNQLLASMKKKLQQLQVVGSVTSQEQKELKEGIASIRQLNPEEFLKNISAKYDIRIERDEAEFKKQIEERMNDFSSHFSYMRSKMKDYRNSLASKLKFKDAYQIFLPEQV